jgi:Family of unknown function (DUF6526)
MAAESQTYKNHVRWFAPLHFFVLPVLLANAINAIRHVWLIPTLGTGFALLVAVAILGLGVLSRVMALTVQDRVIRLEMRLRLRECLPADLRNRINDLTPPQLVALRFASDAELADMVRDVLAGKLASQREIKMRVKDWQGDFLRA